VIRVPEYHNLVQGPGLPHVAIRWYGMMLLLGFLAGMLLARRLARRERVPPESIYDLALWALVSGLLGARLWFVLENPQVLAEETNVFRLVLKILNFTDGGLVYYGGVVAPILVLWWWFRRHRLPTLKMLDILMPAAMLGLAFGRVGCFLNGCCFGRECAPQFPLALQRPADSATWWFQVHHHQVDRTATWSNAVYPTQLMSALDAGLLCLLLLWLFRYKKRDGDILAATMLLYPPVRFVEEWLRAHESISMVGAISVAQVMSILAMVSGALMLVLRRRRPLAGAYVPPPPPSESAPPNAAATKDALPKHPPPRRRKRRPPA
jgi:phosphatidylglycerol:prolipoprotein diacylglycerol transferase